MLAGNRLIEQAPASRREWKKQRLFRKLAIHADSSCRTAAARLWFASLFIRWVLVSQALPTPSRKLPVAHRLALAALATVGLTLLVTARFLEPDPRGYGTHEQLGLTPCYFQVTTGYPCPTCGATTAWGHALRGNLAQAAAANLGGVLSCAATIVGVPWLLLTAILARWPIAPPHFRSLLVLATVWLLIALLDWLRHLVLNS
ncbi:MAG: DUF2752 domain-containing protein [Planctomycetes bacterium]|nr:DUF2752 domain-containing protein [Planctomycetota bacterium]